MNRNRNDQKNSKYNDKVVAIKRASKAVKGGHTMRSSAPVIVGDDRGKAGVGLGKTGEVPEVTRGGKEVAMKNIVTVAIDENKGILYDFTDEYGNAVVLMKRAPEGTGIITGGPAHVVVKFAGVQNTRTKLFDSNSKISVAPATLEGFEAICSPEEIAKRRGRSMEDILDRGEGQEYDETT